MLQQKEQNDKAKARASSPTKKCGNVKSNPVPKAKLTNDPMIKPLLKKLKQIYDPITITKYTATRAYGARKPPFEKFVVNGEVLSIWNKANVVLVKSHNSWLPFNKFFKQFAILHELTSLVAEENKEDYKAKIHMMEAMVHSVKGDISETAENAHSSLQYEKAQEELLKEQIASTAEKIASERDMEDEMMVELHTRNAELINAKKLLEGDRCLWGCKPKGFLKLSTLRQKEKPRKQLTLDEAITATMLEVQNGTDFSDTVFMPTKTNPSGNFRTYLINGNSVLLKMGSNGTVHVRDEHNWIDIWAYLAKAQNAVKAQVKKNQVLASKQAAKKKVTKQFDLDAKSANAKLKYTELANEYARSRSKLSTISNQGQSDFQKKQLSVEELQFELQQLEDLQKAARARNHSLLQNMEEKNKEILTDIESSHGKLLSEASSDVNFEGHQTLEEMQNKAGAAREEYLRAKAALDINKASTTALDPKTLGGLAPRTPSPTKAVGSRLSVTTQELEQHRQDGKSAQDELEALFSEADDFMQTKR